LKQQFIQDVGLTVRASVAGPDPFVFGPPGSGSFYHRAKIVKKNLIRTDFDFFMTFYL
jgi:hypothetical protein